MTTTLSPLTTLADGLEAEFTGTTAKLTEFPSGGAMLDVRRGDGRLFVLDYIPSQGYGVDEARPSDGFGTGYRFAFADFGSAAEKLRQLLADSAAHPRLAPPAAVKLVVVYTRDIEAARRFYECLGLIFQTEQHGRGPEHYSAQVGPTVFEIYPAHGDSSGGCIRIGFEVSSLETILSALQERPAKIHKAPFDSIWGRQVVVEDPDGNRVELTEPRS